MLPVLCVLLLTFCESEAAAYAVLSSLITRAAEDWSRRDRAKEPAPAPREGAGGHFTGGAMGRRGGCMPRAARARGAVGTATGIGCFGCDG